MALLVQPHSFPLLVTILLLLLASAPPLAIAGQQEQQAITLAGCPDKCGNISVPFPFGWKPNCFQPGFEIVCNTSFDPARAFFPDHYGTASDGTEYLNVAPYHDEEVSYSSIDDNSAVPSTGWSTTPVELMDFSASKSEVRAYGAVTSQCLTSERYTSKKVVQTTRLDLTFYQLSMTRNELVGVGVRTGAVLAAYGMPSARSTIKCSRPRLCNSALFADVTDLRSFSPEIELDGYFHPGTGEELDFNTSPCTYSMVVEKSGYKFSTHDLYGNDTLPKRFPRGVPVVLDFAMEGWCPEKGQQQPPGYACVSGNSSCANATTGWGYVCKCSEHYDGNPYIANGCQDIDECAFPGRYPCVDGICKNRPGGYDCPCKPGKKGDGKEKTCTDIFPLAAKATLGAGLGVFSVVVAVLLELVRRHKRRMDEYFRRNGGEILQRVKSLTILTKDELKIYTKNYSEFLGEGKFGKVYKGTLADGTIVAVKKFIEVNEATVEDFANEVEIQANMIHTNILKLRGCCLELDVPMLVYEFAAKGNLENFLHGSKKPLSLNLRLDIAIGAAEGLKYMHSNAAKPIRHGDVKPDNILLDDKMVPKISDFGLSKLLNQDVCYTSIVIGAMGYIDPVFMKTGKESLKNDVYSFGVILLELITRKKILYGENRSLIKEFCKVFDKEKSGRAMFDKEIETEDSIIILEEIGKLAIKCLNDDDEGRPHMTEVEYQLKMLRRNSRPKMEESYASPQHFEIDVDNSLSGADITGISNATSSFLPN